MTISSCRPAVLDRGPRAVVIFHTGSAVPHTTGETGPIICITTGSADPQGLNFVRNGLAFAGP